VPLQPGPSGPVREIRASRGRLVRSAVAGAAAVLALAACGGGSSPKDLPLNGVVASETPSPSVSDQPTPTDGASASPAASSTGELPAYTPTPTTATSTARAVTRTTTRTTSVRAATTSTRRPTATTTAASASALPAVLAAERTAVTGATSVKVAGTVVAGGKKYTVAGSTGTNAELVIGFDAGTLTVRRVGSNVYLQADDAFWVGHGHPELVATYHDLWMPIDPADPAYATIAKITYVKHWGGLATSAPSAKVAAGPAVGGTPTIAISGGSGATAGTRYVASSGKAYPLKSASADSTDTLTWAWNAGSPPVTAPATDQQKDEPADDVIDVPEFAEDAVTAWSSLWAA